MPYVGNNISLKTLNTFGIEASAAALFRLTAAEELENLHDVISSYKKYIFLGGGSNILFTQDYDGLVVHNTLKGIKIVNDDSDNVWVEAAAGENWHTLVLWCIDNGYGGLENLSLIPGTVGAAPIQNIGAYGVEVKNTLYEVNAIELALNKSVKFSNTECDFGYRTSIFKTTARGKFLITSVVFKLEKNPEFNTSYGAIETELQRMNITQPSLRAISDAVIAIRKSKLPDPAIVGNAGSFFKNPEVDAAFYHLLKTEHETLVAYPLPSNNFKIAAGWLIEQCGFKGYVKGRAGCHKNQALVLINLGNATGNEILALAEEIKQAVQAKFQITLEFEVNII